jgi:polyhydroxybutyrate depolymerase
VAWTGQLGACGGGGAEDQPSSARAGSQLLAVTVAGFAHAVDVCRTAGAARAIVVLHGGGGNRSAIACPLGLNSSMNTVLGFITSQ